MQQLTLKQLQVLKFIETEQAHEGRAPTLRATAKHFKKAVSTIQDHIEALIEKGYLQKDLHRACGLKLAHQAEMVSVPILGSVPAGRPIEAIEEALGSVPVSARIGGDLYALKVKGESMVGAGILDGDLVIVKQQESANHGEIVVAMIDGEATVKTYDKKGMRLLAENPKFAPIPLDPSRDNVILGKVMSVQRYY